jgi:glycosyltransferase involved in cell wall biosynthesis
LAFPTSLQAARRLNLPLVITLHGVFPWIRYYPTTLQYAKKVIAIGPAQVKGAEPHQEKVEIIPNGIDTIHFCPSMHRSRRISDTLKVLWFGRTDGTSSRGVKVLDQVIKILRTRKIKVDACAIGIPTGVSVVHLKTYGWIDNPVPILQSGHITFGHGRALREAMSCGNIGFLLGHGYGGQVKKSWFTGKSIMPVSAIPEYGLPKPDAEKIASDISRYVNNDALLYRDCLEARDIAVKFFDVRKMIDEIVKVYRNCVLVSTNNGQYSLNRVGLRSQWKS